MALPLRKRTGVLLAPGAGADRDQSTLVALDDALTAAGAVVARMDFPYRRAGRRAPDREPVLLSAVREVAAAVMTAHRVPAGRLVLGGRSMGGRICSMAAADGLPALGLALISYPLHPPGRPERLRTAHFPRLTMPCLFVSGTRDAFGTPDEFSAETKAIPGPVTQVWIDRKDHGLRGCDAEVAAAVLEWLSSIAS